MSNSFSAKFSLWCSRVLTAIITLLCVGMYWLLSWYQNFRHLPWQVSAAIMAGFYASVPAILYALRCIDRLLCNILEGQVFVADNVRFIRRIRWCCAAVSLICLAAGFLYQPLVFLAVIMAFLALMVSVVKNVLAAAVELREENDLTI